MPSTKGYLRPVQVLSVVVERARTSWAQLGLSIQFTIATSAIMIVGMLMVGHWLAKRIEDAVIQSNAVAAALYVDSFIESRIQVLASHSKLTLQDEEALNALLLPQAVGQPVVGFRIWKGDTIVYGDRRELNGRTFPPSSLRQRAWSGQVAAEYGQLEDPSHAPLGASSLPILEIYAPVRETGTSRIIALAETYQMAPALPDEIAKARVGSWMIVGFGTLSMLFLQSIIVRTGSRTIREQRASLNRQITDLSRLLTDLKRAEEQQKLLIAELDHRVKNTLANVAVVARRTGERKGSTADFIQALDDRLKSMAEAHALLSRSRWQGVSLADLVAQELGPFTASGNTIVEGPNVHLTAATTQAMAMVLHELATNAAKYGALSTPQGRVSVRWRWRSNGGARTTLKLEWQEEDGPVVTAPAQTGYGTSVIRELIPYEVGGTVDLGFAADGVRCTIEIPV